MLLLDDGWSCQQTAKALYLDDDTVRDWRKFYDEGGVQRLRRFEAGGSASLLSRRRMRRWSSISRKLCRVRRGRWACLSSRFGVVNDSRSGLIALTHRLGLEYRKPETIGRRIDAREQQAFIDGYEKLLNSLGPDEATLFVDAAHLTYATQSVGC